MAEAEHDPLEFLKSMWGSMGFTLPGMVTPTLDVGELDKRIADMKAVEGWLKMNLNMLQMSIQGLELQRATLAALQSISESQGGAEAKTSPNPNPFAGLAPDVSAWPWNFLQQAATGTAKPAEKAKPTAGRKKKV